MTDTTRVLIADDDYELCSLIGDYLGAEGMEVDTVHRGDQVIDALQRDNFDLLILDVMLPGRSGPRQLFRWDGWATYGKWAIWPSIWLLTPQTI